MRLARLRHPLLTFSLGFGGVLLSALALGAWLQILNNHQHSAADHAAFLPHGVCFLWDPGLLWLHIVSDTLITLAYFSIPLILASFVRWRKDLPFSGIFLCFGMFIVSCGVTHALGIWTLWHPDYWVEGVAKGVTAFFSIATALLLVPILPQALSYPSPEDLQRANAELQRQQAILRAILDGMQGGVIVCDGDNRILLANPSAQEMLGTSQMAPTLHEQFAGYQVYRSDETTPIPLDRQSLRQSLRGQHSGPMEVYVLAPGADEGHWWSISTSPLRSETPNLVGTVIMLSDVTPRRRAEDALRATEERFRSAFDDAPVGMALLDLDGSWLQVNRSLCQITGYSEAELLATSFQAITHPDDLDTDLAYAGQLLSGEIRSYQMEKRYIHKQGDEVWVLLHGSLIRNAQGQPWYFIAQIQDITQRKQTEDALRESQRFVRSIVETTPDMVYVFDIVNLRNVYANRHPAAVLGYTIEETAAMRLSGTALNTLFHPDDIPIFLASLERLKAAQDNEVIETEYRMRRADGSWRWFYSRDVIFLRDQSGAVVQMLGIAQDITDRKQAEQQTLAALKEKEILLAEIHHRVKNNLQVISSLLKLQASSIDNPVLLEHIRDSQYRVRAMALVHEKLYQASDFAHIDCADYLKSLAHFLVRSFKNGAVIRLKLKVEPIMLDISRAVPLGLILNELLTNALKYAFPHNQGGEICIDMHMDHHALILIVADSGIGLPKTVDLNSPKTLGLRLVHSLVQQLQGTLAFHSDHGTTITITIQGAAL